MKSNNPLSSNRQNRRAVSGRWEPLESAQGKQILRTNTQISRFPSTISESTSSREKLYTGDSKNYNFGKIIGQGAYATVREAVYLPTGCRFAVKSYEKSSLLDPKKKRNIQREIKILKMLDHPHVLKFEEALEDSKRVHIVTELVSGMPLNSYLKKVGTISDELVRKLFIQILSAIKHCHDKGISHRDIKLDNILVDNKQCVKLIDFGFSTYSSENKAFKLYCGTPSYMAPEIALKKEYVGQIADVWALGVLLFAMLTGDFPFKGYNDRDLSRRIARGDVDVPQNIHPQARLMIKRMLQVEPNKRPTVELLFQEKWICIPDFNIDPEIKDIFLEFGCSIEDIKKGLEDKKSEIYLLYNRLEEEKKQYYESMPVADDSANM